MLDTGRDLDALREYVAAKMDLYGNDDLAVKVRNITFQHDAKHDKKNRSNPRFFCYVEEYREGEPWIIRCAGNLELAAPPLRIGVLLHEIGHLVLNAFREGQESEVDVDTWVLDSFPESGYTYRDGAYYPEGAPRTLVTAKDVQHVSPEFVLRIYDELKRRGRPGPR